MKKRVLVAMSGGVDSSINSVSLQRQRTQPGWISRVPIFLVIIIFTYCIHTNSQHQGPIPPIISGYGADSSLTIHLDSIPSNHWRKNKIYLYYPESTKTVIPVIFFLHGLGASDPKIYEHLLYHIAGKGYCVVMLIYKLASFPQQRRTYRKLFSELIYTARQFQHIIDTTRVGFIGHSFGGGAIPALALQCLNNKKWGSKGTFMFIMAPFFVFEIGQRQLEQFPGHVKLIIQVYEEDDCNDHRIAKDLFEAINIPASEKDFMTLLSDSNALSGYKLTADHSVPYSQKDSKGELDGMDYYGIYRIFDALADYTFTQSAEAKEIALGNGSRKQRFMGVWPDNKPVRESLVSDNPILLHPREFYFFHWKHPWNPRRKSRKF